VQKFFFPLQTVFTKNEDIRQKARIALDGTAAFCYHRDNINGQAPKTEVRPQAASGQPSFGVRRGHTARAGVDPIGSLRRNVGCTRAK
jgi:hypothetical protein